jgi:hypothetical protein
MINFPQKIENETVGQYISRLLSEKIITVSQIHLAIQHFNK